MKQSDCIIVGQGLAGSVLALELLKAGKKVLVLDENRESSSSKVAAGIWNPIVFKRITKSWMVDELLPPLFDFYKQIESLSGKSFLHSKNILKIFANSHEERLWIDKQKSLQAYLYEDICQYKAKGSPKFSKVLQAGNIDLVSFLEWAKSYFIEKGVYIQRKVDYKDFQLQENGVTFSECFSKLLIFCEGHNIRFNPYFSWVPLKPAKGEVLVIHCPEWKEKDIWNKSCFILPLGNDLFKVGATYEWEKLDELPTEKGKQALIAKLKEALPFPYQIVKQEAGIRPAVVDRRPVLGKHPEFKQLVVFNGLGTKGVMLAPYFAKHLINFMFANNKLNPESDVSRFYSLYKKS